MAKRPSNQPGRSSKPDRSKTISLNLSSRDENTLEKFAIQDGQHRSTVMREAVDALREKKAYQAKRSIENPYPERPRAGRDIEIREAIPNRISDRPRITTNVDAGTMKALDALAEQSGQSKAELLRGLIIDVVDPDGPAPVRRDVITRKPAIMFFSRLFISALEDAVQFDPRRHHNQPPPPLRIEDDDYLKEVRNLIAELKRLNENLEAASKAPEKVNPKRTPGPRRAAEKSAIDVTKHVNTFLNKYAGALGTGAAALTIGTAGALLYQLGVPIDFITRPGHR